MPALKPLDLPAGRTLLPPATSPDHLYFVSGGLISILYTTTRGETAEIAVVGNEGALGLSLILGGTSPFPAEAQVQSPAQVWRLDRRTLEREFASPDDRLRPGLLGFVQALMAQMAQTAVCYRHHAVEQQLCRWLLMSLDRLGTDELPMTQDTIAQMIGVRRAGVNQAAGRLRSLGLLEIRRGNTRVLDRAGLEGQVCECYGVIRRAYQQI